MKHWFIWNLHNKLMFKVFNKLNKTFNLKELKKINYKKTSN